MNKGEAVGAARIFSQRPERLAALWRRERLSRPAGYGPQLLLDGVVEEFTRELGRTLSGAQGHPWSRTSGVLRLSTLRGAPALYEEFASLRRCLLDALDAVGAENSERRIVNAAIDDALDSAVGLLHQLEDGPAFEPRVAFGGLVVELFEQPVRLKSRVFESPAPAIGETTHA